MTDEEAQDDELLALSSIYDEKVFSTFSDQEVPYGTFQTNVDLPEEFVIKLGPGQNQVISLPPIMLNFQLPPNYPSEVPPSFTLTCQWLSRRQLTNLCQRLDQLWEENANCEVLFTWTNFLQNEVMEYLKLESPLDLNIIFGRKRRIRRRTSSAGNHEINENEGVAPERRVSVESDHEGPLEEHLDSSTTCDPRAIQDLGAPELLLASILEHDHHRRHEVFNTSLFNCDICFVEKLGDLCTQFNNCKHVFCKDCIRGYLEVQIKEGNVTDLHCPHNECDTQTHPSQVKELVSDALFAQYDRLLLQTSLDKMSDICYCPRTNCQSPVLKDAVDTLLGQCPKCYYVFCTLCSSAYHGSRTPCVLKLDNLRKLRESYKEATPEEKEFLTKKYGKRAILQALEETVSLEWLGQNTKRCPDCGTYIQKNHGCNKMTCLKCRCYFCYICGTRLHPSNPYSHYNVMRGTCFGKLFQGLEGDDSDDDDDDYDDEFDFLEEWVL